MQIRTLKDFGELIGIELPEFFMLINPSIMNIVIIHDEHSLKSIRKRVVLMLLTGKESEELDPNERELINLYRQADERGKKRIRQTAELEAQEAPAGVSTSKIG